MLNNLVIGPEKFVIFIDNHTNSYEPIAQKLLNRILNGDKQIYHCPKKINLPLNETNQSINVDLEVNAVPNKSNVILENILKLELNYSIRDIVQLIHKLKLNSNVKQIFGWATAKPIQDEKLIPFLAYLADIVVTIQNENTLNILTKRTTGSVFRKEYQYEISNNMDIIIKEKPKSSKKPVNIQPAIDPDSLATFKINVDEEEQIARNALKLPFERNADAPKTSQIFYQPDSDDDFDDEDPDEDLNI